MHTRARSFGPTDANAHAPWRKARRALARVAPPQDQVTYELYYNGQLATSALASQLEERIAALESAIGTVPYEEVRGAAAPARRADHPAQQG